VERFLQAIGFVGIASIDARYDRRYGTYQLLDVNPRTGAAFRVFENVHGIDVIRALHLDLSGREVPRGPQREQRTYIVEPYSLRSRRAYRDAGLTRRAWLRDFVTADERAWITRDDLRPATVYALHQYVRRRRPPPPAAAWAPAPAFFPGRLRSTPDPGRC
jgi:D-aspartate ligase